MRFCQWRWEYVWVVRGDAGPERQYHRSYSDRRHIAEMEIRRMHQGLCAEGWAPLVLAREEV